VILPGHTCKITPRKVTARMNTATTTDSSPQGPTDHPHAPSPQSAPADGAQQAPAVDPDAAVNVFATLALISSVFIAPAAIILGHIALEQIKTTGEGGRSVAIAGLAIGYTLTAGALLGFGILSVITAISWAI
jgi:hypothetical protein